MNGLVGRARDYLKVSVAAARAGGLPVTRQLAEMVALLVFHGLGPGYYHLAGFSRRHITWTMKRNHLGGRAYSRRVNTLNDPRYQKLSQHKLAEKAIFSALSIPTPRLLGYLHYDTGRTRTGGSLKSASDLDRFLLDGGITRFCAKPVEGHGGRGFIAVEVQNKSTRRYLIMQGDEEITAQTFWERYIDPRLGVGEAMVLEEYFTQHAAYGQLNPSSVNTLRIWVRVEARRSRSLLGYVRFGRAGALVDNQSAGGLVSPVNLENGEVQQALCGSFRRQTYDVHPDHGARITGHILPFVKDAVRLAEDSVRVFPGLRFAGVDVAMGDLGPVLLELNPAPDRQGSAFVDIPSRSLLE